MGEQRLVPARSANLEDLAPNTNLAGPPYNIIKGLLVETETCTRNSTAYSQGHDSIHLKLSQKSMQFKRELYKITDFNIYYHLMFFKGF